MTTDQIIANVIDLGLDPAYIGRVGLCSKGTLGLITHAKALPWGASYVGIKLEDGTQWASRWPKLASWADVAAFAELRPTESPVGDLVAQIATFREDLRLVKEQIALHARG